MSKQLLPVALVAIACAATANAQTDFRGALQSAFPASVMVQTDGDPAVAPPNRIIRRGPWAHFDLVEEFAISSHRAGFAVAADLVATHLPSSAGEVTVTTADGEKLAGEVVARDYVTGLALVRIKDAQFVSLMVGAGTAEPGTPVVISRLTGSGVPQAKAGMIASEPAAIDSQIGFTQYLSANLTRTDIGAPVLDSGGVVVGIVGTGQTGKLVCLPTEPLQRLMDSGDQPIDGKRGMVGIQFSSDGNQPLITQVSDDSPAADAGLQSGDKVLKVNERDVRSASDVVAAVAMSRAGDAVPIVVQRGDETIELVITLKEHPRQEFAQADGDVYQQFQQAWGLKDGRLVPLKDGRVIKGEFMLKDFEDQLKDMDLIFPGLPKTLEGIEIERSDLEDSLQKLEAEKKDQQSEIKDLKKKLRELQDKLQDS